jgi:hypothetical protein
MVWVDLRGYASRNKKGLYRSAKSAAPPKIKPDVEFFSKPLKVLIS